MEEKCVGFLYVLCSTLEYAYVLGMEMLVEKWDGSEVGLGNRRIRMVAG